MLKETLISLFALILIVVGNNVTESYATDAINNLSNELQTLRTTVDEEEDYKKASEQANGVYNSWKDKYSKLAYFIEHNELEKVETALTQARSNIETEEKAEAVSQIDTTMFLLTHIQSKLSFELENIF